MAFGISAGAWLVGGTALAGGLMASKASGDATDAQSAAAASSDAEQRRQYDTTREDNAPFRETGLTANNRLSQLMGLSPGGADNGSLARNFTMADRDSDPVYQSGLQFGLDEGTKGINRQAAAGGNMLSGATLKALTRFGNDYGSTKAGESFNRFNVNQDRGYNKMAGLSGAGMQATNQVNAAGQNMANNISSTQQGMGNARASGYIAQGNAWQNALNQGVSAFNNRGSNQGMLNTANGTNDPIGSFGAQKGWW